MFAHYEALSAHEGLTQKSKKTAKLCSGESKALWINGPDVKELTMSFSDPGSHLGEAICCLSHAESVIFVLELLNKGT